MAWTQQAWRHSLAGLPDPSQADTEQQWRLSLANVPNASDLYVFVPLALDYDEALSLQAIPHPAQFDVTTRYAIGNVAAIGLSDSIDRDGDIDTTIGSFVPDLDGTFTVPNRDGDIVTVISGFSSDLLGEFGYRHYFNISYSVTPTWTTHLEPARFGDVDTTISGFTSAVTGYSLPPDSTQGDIDTTLSAFTADLDGTFTPAPNRDGDISVDINNFSCNLTGSFFISGSFGLVDTSISEFTAVFEGTSEPWDTDGTIGVSLGAFTNYIEGQFTDSDAAFGLLDSVVTDFSATLTGTATKPANIDSVIMRVDQSATAKMRVDQDAQVKMRT